MVPGRRDADVCVADPELKAKIETFLTERRKKGGAALDIPSDSSVTVNDEDVQMA